MYIAAATRGYRELYRRLSGIIEIEIESSRENGFAKWKKANGKRKRKDLGGCATVEE